MNGNMYIVKLGYIMNGFYLVEDFLITKSEEEAVKVKKDISSFLDYLFFRANYFSEKSSFDFFTIYNRYIKKTYPKFNFVDEPINVFIRTIQQSDNHLLYLDMNEKISKI